MAYQTPYENFVIEDYIKSYLNTQLAMSKFLRVDESLVGTDGLNAVIHRYSGTGNAQDLAQGAKNNVFVDAEWTEEEYTASRHQATTKYYDDQQFKDSTWVSAKIQYLGQSMINDFNLKAIGEMAKTNNVVEGNGWGFDTFADAVGRYAEEHEAEDGLLFVVDIKLVPEIRKALADTLQYVEAYVRQGYLGTVCGVPIYPTKLLAGTNIGYLINPEAIRDFVKTNVRVEQNRDVESKENVIVADRYDIIALVDSTKCIMVGPAQETAVSITDISEGVITGGASTGATVKAYVNGEFAGQATESSGYSITSTKAIASDDVVMVVAELDGYAKSVATTVVD